MCDTIAMRRVVLLGGGHGVSSVLRAVRGRRLELTVIVTVADDGGSSGQLRRQWGGPAVGDMRRILIALAGEEAVPARAFARRLTINRLGEHPLGNLLLGSLAGAFGDLELASAWLCGQLGVSARVLPATTGPVSLIAETDGGVVRNESAITTTDRRIRRLGFDPDRPKVPAAVIESIDRADWVLLGPGSLFTSVLAVCALPDIVAALTQTSGRVLWICNLQPDEYETSGMTAADHLHTLHRHGVRVDAVLYDPQADLKLAPHEVAVGRPVAVACPLRSRTPGLHDPVLLGEALDKLFGGRERRTRSSDHK
jgi:uncharacterized cofD-like protein